MALPIQEAFEVLQNREEHFEKIAQQKFPKNIVVAQIALICLFTFFYGLIMGSYNGFQQALSSGIKLWLLLFVTLTICFPSFYIVQLILGSKITIKQLLVILLSGFVMTTTILLAFAPIVLFFQLSGDNYQFLQLLHVFIFIFAGFFGMRVVLEALKSAFEGTNVYPKIGLNVFRIWVIIFAFVGVQLAWNLRPFIGSKDMKFELVRNNTQGNFYSHILKTFGQLLGVPTPTPKPQHNSIKEPAPTTVPPKQQRSTPPQEEVLTTPEVPKEE